MVNFLDVHCSLDSSNLLCLVPDVSRVKHQGPFSGQLCQLKKGHHLRFLCKNSNGIGNVS